MMGNSFSTTVRGGKINVYENIDPDNPGVTVMYQPHGCDFEIDLVYIENTDPELEATGSAEDVRILVYSNVFSEDYSHSFTIHENDVKDMVRNNK